VSDQNSGTHTAYNMSNLKINSCPQTMYITPVSESETEKVVKNLNLLALEFHIYISAHLYVKCE
jgi:hypothetical protein